MKAEKWVLDLKVGDVSRDGEEYDKYKAAWQAHCVEAALADFATWGRVGPCPGCGEGTLWRRPKGAPYGIGFPDSMECDTCGAVTLRSETEGWDAVEAERK